MMKKDSEQSIERLFRNTKVTQVDAIMLINTKIS